MNGKKIEIEKDGKEYLINLYWSDWEGDFLPRMKFSLDVNGELIDEGVMKWNHYHWVYGFEREGHQFTLVAKIPKSLHGPHPNFVEVDCYVDGISQTDGSDLDVLCERLEKMCWWQKLFGIFNGEDLRYYLRGMLFGSAVLLAILTVTFLVRIQKGMKPMDALSDALIDFVVYFIAAHIGWFIANSNVRSKRRKLIRQLKEQSKIAKK